MVRIRGWGLLLAVFTPLLIWFSWSQLSAQKSRINLDRFEAWSGSDAALLIRPLSAYFLRNRKLAMPGDVNLPAVPKDIGVKAWSIQPDSTLLVELDAKVDGSAVRLKFVPVIRNAEIAFYDCVSSTAKSYIDKFCRADELRSVADIPARLEANAKMQATLPTALGASGSVVAVPQKVADLNNCGFQCVKPQSCVTPRPLACSRTVDEGNGRWLEVVATSTDFRGDSFASRGEADQACVQSLGAGYSVLSASSISGIFKLAGGDEYWLQNDVNTQNNCWRADAQ